MILADSSVWVDHLRRSNTTLSGLLCDTLILGHPFITGELACGNLSNRREILRLLDNLPRAKLADHSEALFFIEQQQLIGRGIGYVDAHPLASTTLTLGARLWTRDRRLQGLADAMGVAYSQR